MHDWNGVFKKDNSIFSIPYQLKNYNVKTRSLYYLNEALTEMDNEICNFFDFNIYTSSNITTHSLRSNFFINKPVLYNQLFDLYSKANFLLLLMEERIDGKGKSCFMTGKLYEYLSSGKPLICIGSENYITELLDNLDYPYLRFDNAIGSIKVGLENLFNMGFEKVVNMDKYKNGIKSCLRSHQAEQLLGVFCG